MEDSINLSIPSLNLGSPSTIESPKYTKTATRSSSKSKKLMFQSSGSISQASTRGGPEGDSVIEKKRYGPLPTGAITTTPKNSTTKKKNRHKSGGEENKTPSPTPTALLSPASGKKRGRSKSAPNKTTMTEMEFSVDSPTKSVPCRDKSVSKKNKKTEDDGSWEAAVEKARGLPEGAASGEENEEEMEEDTPTSKNKKDQKKKKLNVLQTAAKKLKKLKGDAGSSDSKSPKKRKRNDSSTQEGSPKKPKMEELTKKERKKQRKMQRNNFEVALRAKKMWEQLRRFDLPPEKRHELSSELYNLIRGRAKELIFAHDTSRVIQSIMKYGAQEHKNALFEELRDDIPELMKSKYAKFFVRKLLKYGTKAQRNYVFRKLHGNARKLVRHKEAAEIVECAFNDYANAAQRNTIVEEFYGPSFALYKTQEDRTIDQIMTKNPEKRDMILRNMKETLSVLVDKTVLQYSIVHKVFLDYFTYATDKMRSDMIEVVREGLIHMLHTRDGARVGMICLWYGTAKDRKVIVKSFKTYVSKICREEYGHMVLLAMFDVVDDTKLIHKAVLEELMSNIHDIAMDQYGRKVLLYLLRPRDPHHFHPDVVQILQQGDNNPNSKKNTEVRRKELLEPISKPLVQYIVQHCQDLVTENATLVLLLSILTYAKADPTAAMQAVARIASEPFVAGSLENCHLVEHTAGHMTLKRLILNDGERMKAGEKVLFSEILVDMLPGGALKSWAACNRGCFVLVTLLELNHPGVTTKVKSELKSVKQSLEKMDFKGAQVLLSKLQD